MEINGPNQSTQQGGVSAVTPQARRGGAVGITVAVVAVVVALAWDDIKNIGQAVLYDLGLSSLPPALVVVATPDAPAASGSTNSPAVPKDEKRKRAEAFFGHVIASSIPSNCRQSDEFIASLDIERLVPPAPFGMFAEEPERKVCVLSGPDELPIVYSVYYRDPVRTAGVLLGVGLQNVPPRNSDSGPSFSAAFESKYGRLQKPSLDWQSAAPSFEQCGKSGCISFRWVWDQIYVYGAATETFEGVISAQREFVMASEKAARERATQMVK